MEPAAALVGGPRTLLVLALCALWVIMAPHAQEFVPIVTRVCAMLELGEMEPAPVRLVGQTMSPFAQRAALGMFWSPDRAVVSILFYLKRFSLPFK